MNQKITQMIIQTIIMMIEIQYYKYVRLGVELEVTTTTTMNENIIDWTQTA